MFAVVGNTDMPTLDHDHAAVTCGMDEFSVPTSLTVNLRFDLLHRNRRTGPEQLVAALLDRLLRRVAV
jgi:hypothetical protein